LHLLEHILQNSDYVNTLALKKYDMLGIKSLIGLLGFSMLASEITVGASPTYVLNLSTLTKSKRDLL
jgi:hypothetical protein